MPNFSMPVEGPRVLPVGTTRRPADPELANGRPCFRVTQSYYARDYYWNDGRIHGALDFGNFYCGDRVVAAESGVVIWVGSDQYGARGVKIRHADGYTTEYWHLASWAVWLGQPVNRGAVIGRVGGTGLARGICHLHFAMYRNGASIDPWPLLHQPGVAPAPAPSSGATKGRAKVAGPNCNIRRDGSMAAAIYARSRTDGWTYRVSDGRRLWANGSQFLFYGWTAAGWARLYAPAVGLSLYTHRSVTIVTASP